jgi:hypothetical protein
MPDTDGKILLYQADDGNVSVDVRFEDETLYKQLEIWEFTSGKYSGVVK